MIFALAFLCVGCAQKEPEKTEIVQTITDTSVQTTEEKSADAVTQTPETAETVLADGKDHLTEEEVDWFNEKFFNREAMPGVRDRDAMQNYFLNSEYTEAADVDLKELCRDSRIYEPDEKEKEQLSQVAGESVYESDVSRYTKEELDAMLQKYTGLTLEDSNKIGLDQLVYLSEYDAYYYVCGDTHYRTVQVVDGYWDGQYVILEYELNGGDIKGEVVLQVAPDRYVFCSNVYTERE
jgi:hypothetical protein